MTRARRKGKGEEDATTVVPEAKELPVLMSLCCIHRDKESGHGARLVHKGRDGCGDRQEWDAI
eukprot:5927076-Pleurochrysis_carterae.AAC.1